MTRKEFMKEYWRYYLVLEERFLALTRYIEPNEDNGYTYSVELISQLQTIGSEADVFMKVVCGFAQDERRNIGEYRPIILQKYPRIESQKVKAFDWEIKPFEEWSARNAKDLEWWSAYNNVKHRRGTDFKQGNLKMVLYALAALYLLEMYYLKTIADKNGEKDIPDKLSEIFSLSGWSTRYIPVSGLDIEVNKTKEMITIGKEGYDMAMDGGGAEG